MRGGIFEPLHELKNEEAMMGQTIVYGLISLVICVAFFTLVDHYFMDMQGLDYWYLFRQ